MTDWLKGVFSRRCCLIKRRATSRGKNSLLLVNHDWKIYLCFSSSAGLGIGKVRFPLGSALLGSTGPHMWQMKAATVTHIRIKSTPNRGKSSHLSPAILWIHTTSLDKKSVNPASYIRFDLTIFTGGKSTLIILYLSNCPFLHQHLAMESKKFCGSSVASEDQIIQIIGKYFGCFYFCIFFFVFCVSLGLW